MQAPFNFVPDSTLCCPIRIALEGDGAGRIGGSPPRGVRGIHSDAQYFCTLPFSRNLVASVLGRFAADEWFEAFGLVQRDSRLIEVIIHQPAPRSQSGEQASELESYGVEISEVIKDVEPDGGFYPFHKLGGRAARLPDDPYGGLIDAVEGEGFNQFCQFEFPTPRDEVIGGSWPFGDSLFHLWARQSSQGIEWAWLAGHR